MISSPQGEGEEMPESFRLLYYQWTLGPAHMARIRALDSIDGVSCHGVQLASNERTRQYRLTEADWKSVDTLLEGVYEDLSLVGRIRAACSHLRRISPDAIIVDSPADPVQFALGRYARRLGIFAYTRWAATVNDHPRFFWKEYLKGFVYRGWDHYLVTGQHALRYLASFGIPSSHATICGNPVDGGPIESARGLAERTRESSFLFVGRFLALKNLEAFLPAFLRYREQGGTWVLKIAGAGSPDEEARVRALSHGDSAIEFLGHLQFDELIEAYLNEGCFVLPSYSENWGLVVNEAMHAGMPLLLSSLCGCIPELLVEGENGFAFNPLIGDSMTEALHRMERIDPERRTGFSLRSRLQIETHTAANWAQHVAIVFAGEMS